MTAVAAPVQVHSVSAIHTVSSRCESLNSLFMALLLVDYDLGHHPAVILSVIAEIVQVGGVEEIGSGSDAAVSISTSTPSPPPSVTELVS